MACCSWPGPLGFPGVGVGFRGVGRGGVRGFVGWGGRLAGCCAIILWEFS